VASKSSGGSSGIGGRGNASNFASAPGSDNHPIDRYNPDDMDSLNAAFGSWADELSSDEQIALEAWAGSSGGSQYRAINGYIGGDSAYSGDQKLKKTGLPIATVAQSLKSAVQKSRAPVDLVAHRGTTAQEISDWVVGEERRTSRFMTTSLDKSFANGFARSGGARIIVRAPKGSRVALLDAAVSGHAEAETLFPPGTRFRVRSITHNVTAHTGGGAEKRISIVEIDVLP
jgi:hypothetical protein